MLCSFPQALNGGENRQNTGTGRVPGIPLQKKGAVSLLSYFHTLPFVFSFLDVVFITVLVHGYCYFIFKIHLSHKFVGVIQPISATRGVNKRKAFLLNPAVRLTP